MKRVEELIASIEMDAARLENLKTAVAEATMNAIEHGNREDADVPVRIAVLASEASLSVRITDNGGGSPVPEAETPDLAAKLAGDQKPRGWGLFLIQNMVDEMNVESDDSHHTVELVMHLRGDS
jgi:anti-sigma regulatory factor (Ser/Thr protein kinase)